MTTLFPELPDHARVRVFHAERSLTKDEEKKVASVMDAFVAQWTAHEAAVLGRWALLESRFIVVAVDETRTALTGCSKDSLVRAVRAAEGAAHCAIVGAPPAGPLPIPYPNLGKSSDTSDGTTTVEIACLKINCS